MGRTNTVRPSCACFLLVVILTWDRGYPALTEPLEPNAVLNAADHDKVEEIKEAPQSLTPPDHDQLETDRLDALPRKDDLEVIVEDMESEQRDQSSSTPSVQDPSLDKNAPSPIERKLSTETELEKLVTDMEAEGQAPDVDPERNVEERKEDGGAQEIPGKGELLIPAKPLPSASQPDQGAPQPAASPPPPSQPSDAQLAKIVAEMDKEEDDDAGGASEAAKAISGGRSRPQQADQSSLEPGGSSDPFEHLFDDADSAGGERLPTDDGASEWDLDFAKSAQAAAAANDNSKDTQAEDPAEPAPADKNENGAKDQSEPAGEKDVESGADILAKEEGAENERDASNTMGTDEPPTAGSGAKEGAGEGTGSGSGTGNAADRAEPKGVIEDEGSGKEEDKDKDKAKDGKEKADEAGAPGDDGDGDDDDGDDTGAGDGPGNGAAPPGPTEAAAAGSEGDGSAGNAATGSEREQRNGPIPLHEEESLEDFNNATTIKAGEGPGPFSAREKSVWSREMDSFAGFVVGLFLLVMTPIFLCYHEMRHVRTLKRVAIMQKQAEVIESPEDIGPGMGGRFVYFHGPVTASSAQDPLFTEFVVQDCVALQREAEIYQHVEVKQSMHTKGLGGAMSTETLYTPVAQWCPQPMPHGALRHLPHIRNSSGAWDQYFGRSGSVAVSMSPRIRVGRVLLPPALVRGAFQVNGDADERIAAIGKGAFQKAAGGTYQNYASSSFNDDTPNGAVRIRFRTLRTPFEGSFLGMLQPLEPHESQGGNAESCVYEDELETGSGSGSSASAAWYTLVPFNIRGCGCVGAVGPILGMARGGDTFLDADLGEVWAAAEGVVSVEDLSSQMEEGPGRSSQLHCQRLCGIFAIIMGWLLVLAPIPTSLQAVPFLGGFAQFGFFMMALIAGCSCGLAAVLVSYIGLHPIRAVASLVVMVTSLLIINSSLAR